MKKPPVAETLYIHANITMPASKSKIAFEFRVLKDEWDSSSESERKDIVLTMARCSNRIEVDYMAE